MTGRRSSFIALDPSAVVGWAGPPLRDSGPRYWCPAHYKLGVAYASPLTDVTAERAEAAGARCQLCKQPLAPYPVRKAAA